MTPRALLALCLLAASPTAAEWIVHPDLEASSIRFVLGATLHKVEGTARLGGGEIRYDPVTGQASGALVVPAASLETGNDRRDRTMHAKVLESETYPEIRLRLDRVDGAFNPSGVSALVLRGEMEIHGSTHRVSLPTSVRLEGSRLTATTEFVVPYVEWGMKNPSRLVLRVEKRVDVAVELVGVAVFSPGPPAPTPDG
ncbi:MAG: YceI family protein [Thermoanaerobaculia bacterium]|nr:YceI family protein [Thermoanaerobaculia bacterium]